YGEAPLETMKGERTDRAIYAVSVRAGEYAFDWQSEELSETAMYETEKKMVKWRNQIFPVEIITHIYYECEPIRAPISEEEATSLAKKQAWQSIAERIPKDAEVKVRRDDIVSDPSASIVRVRAIVETIEEIGVGPDSAKTETEE
ncbi:MAG: sporulation protein YqfD, partial [Selenomonadales bacterium]|nr:sporulation protein YqfD [Selenomonadales bacterium]